MMEAVEGHENESAFYGRIIRGAKRVREQAAESLRLSRARLRKKQGEQADAAQRRRKFRRRD